MEDESIGKPPLFTLIKKQKQIQEQAEIKFKPLLERISKTPNMQHMHKLSLYSRLDMLTEYGTNTK
jgi:hypothetical protein